MLDHPTQILADMMTMEEHLHKPLKECKVAFVGDVRNNMSYAWMFGCCKMGVDFVGYGPQELIDGGGQVHPGQPVRPRARKDRRPYPAVRPISTI